MVVFLTERPKPQSMTAWSWVGLDKRLVGPVAFEAAVYATVHHSFKNGRRSEARVPGPRQEPAHPAPSRRWHNSCSAIPVLRPSRELGAIAATRFDATMKEGRMTGDSAPEPHIRRVSP